MRAAPTTPLEHLGSVSHRCLPSSELPWAAVPAPRRPARVPPALLVRRAAPCRTRPGSLLLKGSWKG